MHPVVMSCCQDSRKSGGRRVDTPALPPGEKDFFLDEFHDTSFLFALHAADVATETGVQELLEICSALLTNEARVLLLIEVVTISAIGTGWRWWLIVFIQATGSENCGSLCCSGRSFPGSE